MILNLYEKVRVYTGFADSPLASFSSLASCRAAVGVRVNGVPFWLTDKVFDTGMYDLISEFQNSTKLTREPLASSVDLVYPLCIFYIC